MSKSVDPSIKIDVKYLTEDPNDGKTGFENPAGGKAAADGQYDDGADVVYHAAGKSGLGVFDAVEAAGEGNVGHRRRLRPVPHRDGGQKPHILTSMLKRIDTAVFDYVKAYDDGASPSGIVTYDLAGRRRRLLHLRWFRRRHQATRSTRPPSRSRAARSRCPTAPARLSTPDRARHQP